jgi:hypothetical protein
VGRIALCVIVAIMGGSPAARGDVAIEAGVPFTAPELTAALAMRGAPPPGDLTIRVVSPTAVELTTAVGVQRIDLGAARGEEAARLVALQLVPLSLEPGLPAPFALAAGSRTGDDHGWMFGITAGGGRGLEGADLGVAAVRAEAMWARAAWRCGVSVGWLHEIAGAEPGMAGITAEFAAIRGVAGIAVGPFELVAGPELVPYRIGGAASGITVGASGSVRVVLVARRSWQALATADIELFAHRLVFERDGMELATTPRAMITAALGVAWGGP